MPALHEHTLGIYLSGRCLARVIRPIAGTRALLRCKGSENILKINVDDC